MVSVDLASSTAPRPILSVRLVRRRFLRHQLLSGLSRDLWSLTLGESLDLHVHIQALVKLGWTLHMQKTCLQPHPPMSYI
ncbi:unnamed protein product [Musa acuminata subsp. burmannicoides]